MAAGAFSFYDQTSLTLLGGADFTDLTLKLALLTSSYTPNQDTDDTWSDVSSFDISAASTGYAAGGYTLTNKTLTEITKGYRFNTDNAVWTAGASNLPTWKWAVMYVSGSTIEGKASPLIGYFQGETTGDGTVPATTSGNQLTIQCPASGWFDLTRP
jgi:hypothetical protein